MANSILAQQLVAQRTRCGKLIVMALHPERKYNKEFQLCTRCDCGKERIITVAEFRRARMLACTDCTSVAHREAQSRSILARNARKKSKLSMERQEQVERLVRQRVLACIRLGIEFNANALRAEIERECSEADYSDLLVAQKFRIEVRRSSSLARAIERGAA